MGSTRIIEQDFFVNGLIARKPEVLDHLYDAYANALYGAILRIVQKEHIAEEVLQDAFLRFWERIDNYDSKKGRFFTWMLNISRNLAIDKLRSKEIKASEKTEQVETFVSKVERDSHELFVDGIGLEKSLNKLKQEERFVLEKVYFLGYTQSEIAKEFEIPLGTIKTRLRMALIHLRELLKEN